MRWNPWLTALPESSIKGSMFGMELRTIEEKKIECARKFFAEINNKIAPEHVQYDMVTKTTEN